MTDLAKAVLLSGAIDETMLLEIGKWKLPINLPDDGPYSSPEEAIMAIEEALEDEHQVEIRATDLDLLREYLRTQRHGKLHIETDTATGTVDVTFGVTTRGEYIIPWRSETLTDVLTNGRSYLLDGRRKVFLLDVRESYFGESKAFVVCTPEKAKNGSRHKS